MKGAPMTITIDSQTTAKPAQKRLKGIMIISELRKTIPVFGFPVQRNLSPVLK
jgi:hypothetical protein